MIIFVQSEQLKDLDNLRKQVEDLQGEKNELAKVIEKLKHSKDCFENEKRDIIVTMEMQNNKFETRENELLTTIQVGYFYIINSKSVLSKLLFPLPTEELKNFYHNLNYL